MSAECKMTLGVVSSYSYLCLHLTRTVTMSQESPLSSGWPIDQRRDPRDFLTAASAFLDRSPEWLCLIGISAFL